MTTNTSPENLPLLKSADSIVEVSLPEDTSPNSAHLNDLSPEDESKNNGTNNKGRNGAQMCWFFMNRNYCRYGRNCRFSHAKPRTPEFTGNRTSGREESTNSKDVLETVNSKSKESYNVSEREDAGQHREEWGNSRDIIRPRIEAPARLSKYSNRRGDISKPSRNASIRVNDYQNHSNPPVPRGQSGGAVRQKNLYFYRSNNKAPQSDTPRTRTEASNRCRYFLKGYCRQGASCKFLHQPRGGKDAVGETSGISTDEPFVPENGKRETEACDEPQLQNCCNVPTVKRLVKLEDADENDIERLRGIEINQLKRRFPGHKLIQRSPEEIFHVTFSPSDPDWSFAVNSVSLEIAFNKKYPREACTIKVLEDDSLPPLLLWHLNKCISEWIKEKHQSAVAIGKIELLFRPFLRWFDRNLEKLFIVGLRKVKQDVLAKEAGIEFVPYEELRGASPLSAAAVETEMTADHEKQDDCLSAAQKSDGIDLVEKLERNTISESVRNAQHVGDNYVAVQEGAVDSLRGVNASYPPTSAEKENFSPDLLGMKFSSSKGSPYPIGGNIAGFDSFSVPKLGTEIKLVGLELKEGVATMVCTKAALTLQCGRCKTRHEINTPPKRNNSLNCIKCHHSMQIVFQSAMLHPFSAAMGYLHLIECQAVDIPMMECNFSVDCLNCSKQNVINGIHYGQQKVTWCLFCNTKLSIYMQSVKFHQLQPAMNIGSPGHRLTTTTKREKKVVKDPAIQEGKPLPDCGTCKHYKKSYRWLRFPCCGKAYPCDACHEEKETDHEMKYASRMICGFCAKEQPYAGVKPCISCSANMTKKAGAHWEGGKGCRDKITMSREDHQKYEGMSKTVSRKAQNQKPGKK